MPIDVFQRDEVEDVSARDLRDGWGRTGNAWHSCILAVVADDVAVVVETPSRRMVTADVLRDELACGTLLDSWVLCPAEVAASVAATGVFVARRKMPSA